MLLMALVAYGAFAVWRVFPRFDSRLIGPWTIPRLSGPEEIMVFQPRGFGMQGYTHSSRTFRWWICGNVLVKHPDRGSHSANVRTALEYAVRTLLFLGRPRDMAEFDIVRLDPYGAQFEQRPRRETPGFKQTLVLRR